MISGGVAVLGVERLHSTPRGRMNTFPVSLTPGSLSARCIVANDSQGDSLSSPLARDSVKSGSDLTEVLQRQSLSLRKEDGGVQTWRARGDDSVTRGAPIRVTRQWTINQIAEAAPSVSEGDQRGIVGSIAADGSAGNGIVLEGGDPDIGWGLDPFGGIKKIVKQAQILKEEVTSLDYNVSPTPYTPIEGAEATIFAIICVGLVFIFWLGNYLIPDLIFKDTVFKKDEPEDLLDPISTISTDNDLESQKESNGASLGDTEISRNKPGAGFSKRKQNRPKSAKRK